VADLGEGQLANIGLSAHFDECIDTLTEVFSLDALALAYSEIDELSGLLLRVGLFFFKEANEAGIVSVSYIGLLFFKLLQLVERLGNFGSVIHKQKYDLSILNQYYTRLLKYWCYARQNELVQLVYFC